MKRTAHVLALAAMFCIAVNLRAQVPTGTPPFGSFGGGPFDVVNLGNLNAHFSIAVRHKAGRITPFAYDIAYDSSVWYPTSVNGVQTWQPIAGYGWDVPTGPSGTITDQLVQTVTRACNPPLDLTQVTYHIYANYAYYDAGGSAHQFNQSSWDYNGGCPFPPPSGGTTNALDGSGYVLTLTPLGNTTVTGPDGKVYISPTTSNTVVTDANGNQISVANGNYTDTLGTNALSISGTFPKSLKYTAPNSTLATWTINYTSYTVKTNFGCSGTAEYTLAGVQLPTSIVLPDSTSYQFTYEQTQGQGAGYTTGRLASVTLPTGGSITYSYPTRTVNSVTYNGINCADGTPPSSASVNGAASMTRALSPGGTSYYYRTQVSGNHWQTKTTDAASNDTVIDFQQDSSTVQYGNTHDFFEVQRLTYQGSSGTGTLLSTILTCYNTNNPTPSTCPTASVATPISEKTVFSYLPDTSSSSKVAETDTRGYFGGEQFPQEIDTYDYGTGGPGPLLRKLILAWTTFGSSSNPVVRPSSITVQDASSITKAQTAFAYDVTALTSTNGTTPQHITPANGNSRGNVTNVQMTVSGSLTLYRDFTYYDTGTTNTATDWGTTYNGGPNVTTYNYPDATSTCGNAFATSVTLPILGTTPSTTFSCVGAVATQTKDLNGNATNIAYNDANYWVPASLTDPLSNVMNFNYGVNTSGTHWDQSYMFFNGTTSVSDSLRELDAFGRPNNLQKQQQQNGSNYDTVTIAYDSVGRPSLSTMPCVAALWAQCSSSPGTTTTYDALNRPVSVQDGGQPTPGYVTYAYTKNDVLQVLGPNPSGENLKRKQFEYDGLGRLTSVCEITAASGSGPCGQTVSQTGFLTTYTYDSLGNLTGVTQNAQGTPTQTRTFFYDDLGRMTSETNPESGTTRYFYDAASSSGAGVCPAGWPASAGDLVSKYDANGITSCSQYDSLHRITGTWFYGQNVSFQQDIFPSKHFGYDAASVNGTSMANGKGRLVEAYTCTAGASTCVGNVITDELFSYSARGENTDLYQSTPHSGGYYHGAVTYYANGALNTLSGVGQQPTYTYGVDGEGRPKSHSQGSTTFVSNTTYNPASQPLIISFGSGDSDTYAYDPNTNRMSSYTFTVGSTPKSLVGQLTWNLNGTLSKLAVTDGFNAAGTQTCKYGDPSASVAGYDDLARLINANCGAIWSQNFSYDPFGNLTKSGTSAWMPGYNQSNNRYTLAGTTYDAAGNLLTDTFHSYTWNADGRPMTIDSTACGTNGICLTYDALNRMVERNAAGTYSQFQYGPTGEVAEMNGQTQSRVYVPLPGGATLYQNIAIWHKDWLGSVRLSSSYSARTTYFDKAYAPFGELYNVVQGGTDHPAFTGDTQDSVAGEYDTPFRLLHPGQGRWISPDPAGLAVVDPMNPQSWNRYAYVGNNPLVFVDPLGLQDCSLLGASFRGGPGCQNPGPGCITSYCPTAYGGMAWNDPINPNAILNAGEQAFQNQMQEVWGQKVASLFGGALFQNEDGTWGVKLPGDCITSTQSTTGPDGVGNTSSSTVCHAGTTISLGAALALVNPSVYNPTNNRPTVSDASKPTASALPSRWEQYKAQIQCQDAVIVAKVSADENFYKLATFAIASGVKYGKLGWVGVGTFAGTVFKNVYEARTTCGASF